jgi:hypothetical protein
VDGEHPVTWIRGGGLALLCSRVPLAEFGEEPLRRNLNDIVWLERIARSHETAIELALEQGTIVPLRLCTIFASEAGAREMLAGQREPLEVALDALEGRVEWSVKLLVDRAQLEAGLPESSTDTGEQAGTGAAYLLRRREERRSREASDLAMGELAEDVHARLQDWADDARVRPAQNPELSGHAGEMVLNGAYLVDRSRSAELRELVAELEQRHRPSGARLELAGPFPPYSFVPEATE